MTPTVLARVAKAVATAEREKVEHNRSCPSMPIVCPCAMCAALTAYRQPVTPAEVEEVAAALEESTGAPRQSGRWSLMQARWLLISLGLTVGEEKP